MADKIIWYSSSENPYKPGYVLIETIESTYYVDYIKPEIFDEWSDEIIRWAYIDDNNYAKYQNALRAKHYKVVYWRNKYLDLLGKQHNEHQRDAFVGKRSKFAIDDCFGDIHDLARSTRDAYIRSCIKETDKEILNDICGSVNSDGDECPATDDLCWVCKSNDARPVSEISINELRDIFLKVMREERERKERTEKNDD